MPSWSEWNNLTEDQKEYELYKTLSQLANQDFCMSTNCRQRLEACESRFKKIEARKYFDKTLNLIGGIIGGFIAVLTFNFFK